LATELLELLNALTNNNLNCGNNNHLTIFYSYPLPLSTSLPYSPSQ
jgi:hypothetical protein